MPKFVVILTFKAGSPDQALHRAQKVAEACGPSFGTALVGCFEQIDAADLPAPQFPVVERVRMTPM